MPDSFVTDLRHILLQNVYKLLCPKVAHEDFVPLLNKMKVSATTMLVKGWLSTKKCAYFVNLSTTTMMVSFPCDGIGRGQNSPTGYRVSNLFCWLYLSSLYLKSCRLGMESHSFNTIHGHDSSQVFSKQPPMMLDSSWCSIPTFFDHINSLVFVDLVPKKNPRNTNSILYFPWL